jgi:hypothetical protein
LLAGTNTVQAGSLPGFTGCSVFGAPCDLCDSVVNFTVYRNTNGNWTDDSFFGGIGRTDLANGDALWGASADTGAGFVYLYQVVNNDPVGMGIENPLHDFNIAMARTSVTGAGYFDGVFVDAGGNIIDNQPDFSPDNPELAALLTDFPDDGGDRKPSFGAQWPWHI